MDLYSLALNFVESSYSVVAGVIVSKITHGWIIKSY